MQKKNHKNYTSTTDFENQEIEKYENIIIGRNSVIEKLKAEEGIEKILIAKGSEGSIKKIEAIAKEKKVIIKYVDSKKLKEICDDRNHQGVVAICSEYSYYTVDEILNDAKQKNEKPFIVILDNLEDPHNLGAIMRSAECCGAHGIIIPKRRSVSLNRTVAKVSAGAIEYMKCAKVSNIVQTIEYLKEKGLWIYQCNMGGEPYYKSEISGSIALVVGSEGNGISRLVSEKCDFTLSIPMTGNINSFNASNAAAVIMCEVARQRNK